MGLLRRRKAEPVPPPEPARKSGRGKRRFTRLLLWLAPVAIQQILRRRKR